MSLDHFRLINFSIPRLSLFFPPWVRLCSFCASHPPPIKNSGGFLNRKDSKKNEFFIIFRTFNHFIFLELFISVVLKTCAIIILQR